LRNFLSWLRGTWVGTHLPIDKNIIFHKGIAWVIMILTSIHVFSHFVNYKNISELGTPQLAQLQIQQSSTFGLAYGTLPGITGNIVCICMIFMYSSAIEEVRRPMFEGFWITHHLFIVYYACISIHGAAGILEPPTFWIWVAGPGVFYMIERIIRLARGSQKTIVKQAIAHPSKVLELRMKKPTFVYKPGQYIFLACPYIGDLEWHPFTISSSPDEDFLSVHIRIVGDWTGDLWTEMNPEKKLGVVQEDLVNARNGNPILLVDGPFGAASEDVFNFEYVILFAAGIGVTPFASILKSIKYKVQTEGDERFKKAHFYWSNRDSSAFEWFIGLLRDLDDCDFLDFNLYLTAALNPDQVREISHQAKEGGGGNPDPLTGLKKHTNYKRPNIKAIIAEKAQEYTGQTVGVFFCGPPVISKQLAESCRIVTDTHTKTKFIFHKENF